MGKVWRVTTPDEYPVFYHSNIYIMLGQEIAAYYILHHMKESITNPSTIFQHVQMIEVIGTMVCVPTLHYATYTQFCEINGVTPAPEYQS